MITPEVIEGIDEELVDHIYKTGHLYLDGRIIDLNNVDSRYLAEHCDDIRAALTRWLFTIKMAKTLGAGRDTPEVMRLVYEARRSDWFKLLMAGKADMFVVLADSTHFYKVISAIEEVLGEVFVYRKNELYYAHANVDFQYYKNIIFRSILKLIDRVVDYLVVPYEAIKNVVLSICGFGQSMLDALGQQISDILDRALSGIFGRMMTTINDFLSNLSTHAVAACLTTFVVVAAGTLGFFTAKTIYQIAGLSLQPYRDWETDRKSVV